MSLLVDTNILLRAAQTGHPQSSPALAALETLKRRGTHLFLVPQILYEFWVVCTKPLSENGLGLSAESAAEEFKRIGRLFVILPETQQIYSEWERLIIAYKVIGKQAHDARLVAAMRVHSLSGVLTYNTIHFTRFPNISVVSPDEFA